MAGLSRRLWPHLEPAEKRALSWLVPGALLSLLPVLATFPMDRLLVLPSIGVAYFPDHGTDEASLLRRADEAMYQAKSASAQQRCSSPPTVDTLLDKDQC